MRKRESGHTASEGHIRCTHRTCREREQARLRARERGEGPIDDDPQNGEGKHTNKTEREGRFVARRSHNDESNNAVSIQDYRALRPNRSQQIDWKAGEHKATNSLHRQRISSSTKVNIEVNR